MENERIIKKYPNRRLYDTVVSRYVTLADIRQLVKEGCKFRVVDSKTEEDITRSILLQVISEQEQSGQPLFSNEFLEQIIRAYGNSMQGFMATYLEESMAVFLRQQKLVQQQMTSMIETLPSSIFTEMARQNIRLWQSLTETKSKGPESDEP